MCPHCSKKIPSLDGLEADKTTRSRVYEYIEKEVEKSRAEGEQDEAAAGEGPSVVSY